MSKRVYLLVSFSLLLGSQSAWAQLTGATISGTVKDETGAIVPGATVVVKNLETGLTRTLVSDSAGLYHAPNLRVGSYEVTAELSGFQTEVRSGITLTVGRQAVVDFTLKVGEVSQRVTVVGEAPLVDTTTSTVAGVVTETQIRDLPLNGRDFTQLALLQAGVTRLLNTGPSFSQGFGTPASFAGARPLHSTFMLDGTDINTPTSFGLAGSAAGVVLGVDTVQEFQVLISNFSAEFGRAAGGIVNAVTRSGTNELHGSAFEFLRNDNLDARNFFDRAKAEFKRNQFGFTVGGPVKRDKSFFFGSYEGLRQRLFATTTDNVPTLLARQGILPTGPITISPAVKPYLDLFPAPNGRDFGNGIAEFITPAGNPVGENYWVVKVDHRFSDSDSFFVRYGFDDADAEAKPPGFVNTSRLGVTRMQYLVLEEKKVFGPRLVNSVRLAFNRSKLEQRNKFLRPIDPSLSYIPGDIIGQADIPGLSDPGSGTRLPSSLIQNLFQVYESVSYFSGAHALTFGFHLERFQFHQLGGDGKHGWWTFNSYADFLRGQAGTVFFNLPGSDPVRGMRQSLFAFHIQDDFKLKPTFTLNLGLRYEFVTTPTEVNGKVSNIRDFLHDTNFTVGDPWFLNPSLKNFAPRVGFAWDPSGQGKLSLRGGFGIFYDQLTPAVWRFGTTNNPPFSSIASFNNPPYPNFFRDTLAQALQGVSAIDPRTVSTATMDYHASQPYVMKYNLMLEKELFPHTVFSVGYLGNRGIHLSSLVDLNTVPGIKLADGRWFVPAGGTRRNPNFGGIVTDPSFGASSAYNALLLKMNKRLSQGLQFEAGYTYSRNTDDSTTGAAGFDFVPSGWSPQNADCTKCDHGLSNIDMRNNFVFNFRYDLPFRSQQSGLVNHLVGGWQVGGIATLSSGNPFSVTLGFNQAPTISRIIGHQRPDLVNGRSKNPIRPDNPNQYFDPTSFELPAPGFFGNLGRNTLISPGLANFDFSLFKNTQLAEKKTLQFRAEFFNLFNRANFGRPGVLHVFDSRGLVNNVGRITRTTTTSRQIQFGLKFIF